MSCEQKGVKVEARQRYFGLPDSRPKATREQATLVAAYQSVNVSEIALRAGAAPGAAANSAHVEIRLDPDDLLLHENGGRFERC